jgi:hypothetical protein
VRPCHARPKNTQKPREIHRPDRIRSRRLVETKTRGHGSEPCRKYRSRKVLIQTSSLLIFAFRGNTRALNSWKGGIACLPAACLLACCTDDQRAALDDAKRKASAARASSVWGIKT